MSYDATTKTALANEARRQELGKKVAALRGEANATASLATAASSANNDALRRLQAAQAELAALEAGAGPGITEEFGDRSSVDLLLRTERFAGKRASLEHVHANPEASEKEAIKAWETAALAETGLSALLQDPAALGALYRANLKAAGAIADATWEAQRAWILGRTVDEAMGL